MRICCVVWPCQGPSPRNRSRRAHGPALHTSMSQWWRRCFFQRHFMHDIVSFLLKKKLLGSSPDRYNSDTFLWRTADLWYERLLGRDPSKLLLDVRLQINQDGLSEKEKKSQHRETDMASAKLENLGRWNQRCMLIRPLRVHDKICRPARADTDNHDRHDGVRPRMHRSRAIYVRLYWPANRTWHTAERTGRAGPKAAAFTTNHRRRDHAVAACSITRRGGIWSTGTH